MSYENYSPKRKHEVHETMAIFMNTQIQNYKKLDVIDTNLVSDGYHTFQELYDMRLALTIALFKNMKEYDDMRENEFGGGFKYFFYKSKLHSDGTMFERYFIVGVITSNGQISFHYPLSAWDMFDFDEYDKAPEWDGHTDKDVIKRLLNL